MRWGDRLEFSGEAGPGDFIYVPPYVPHQEINALPDELCEAVVVRSGQDPIVVNLDIESPEPTRADPGAPPFHPKAWLVYYRYCGITVRLPSMHWRCGARGPANMASFR
jgi:hypothetical protein